jgi:hypothetical protein
MLEREIGKEMPAPYTPRTLICRQAALSVEYSVPEGFDTSEHENVLLLQSKGIVLLGVF